MNLREAIEGYANAVSARDYYEDCEDTQREAEAVARLVARSQSLDVVLAVAEAAIAYAEFHVNGWETPMDGATYIRERGKLLDAFIEARAKAANQS